MNPSGVHPLARSIRPAGCTVKRGALETAIPCPRLQDAHLKNIRPRVRDDFSGRVTIQQQFVFSMRFLVRVAFSPLHYRAPPAVFSRHKSNQTVGSKRGAGMAATRMTPLFGFVGSRTGRFAVGAAAWVLVLQALAAFCFSHVHAGSAHAKPHYSLSQPLSLCSASDVADESTPPPGGQIELCCVFHHVGDDQLLAPSRSKRIDNRACSNRQPALLSIFDDFRIADVEWAGWLSSWSALAPPPIS
ncbi:MAG: hypothetical protein N2444_04550 [Methylocystis sp.]|nr:hypothetical protein [Methylocystis sp.]